VVIDVWSRRPVGWSISEQMSAELVPAELNIAIEQRRPASVIHHSDQGAPSQAFGNPTSGAFPNLSVQP
jgi:transposase InsO family protein